MKLEVEGRDDICKILHLADFFENIFNNLDNWKGCKAPNSLACFLARSLGQKVAQVPNGLTRNLAYGPGKHDIFEAKNARKMNVTYVL